VRTDYLNSEGDTVKRFSALRIFVLSLLLPILGALLNVLCFPKHELAQARVANLPAGWRAIQATQNKPVELQVSDVPVAARVLVQSPAETDTEMQIICLFASTPENTLHGSLVETNEKLKGLLDKIRKPEFFRGELGETIVIVPRTGSFAARKLLIIGLGDSQKFAPQRMELVGSIVYRESNRLGVAHPFFAPTILDGGVTGFNTGEVAEDFYSGFLRAARTEKLLKEVGATPGQVLQDLTFLAGPTHAADTQQGLERAAAKLRN
jgi:cytosol aminopeptidase family protein